MPYSAADMRMTTWTMQDENDDPRRVTAYLFDERLGVVAVEGHFLIVNAADKKYHRRLSCMTFHNIDDAFSACVSLRRLVNNTGMPLFDDGVSAERAIRVRVMLGAIAVNFNCCESSAEADGVNVQNMRAALRMIAKTGSLDIEKFLRDQESRS